MKSALISKVGWILRLRILSSFIEFTEMNLRKTISIVLRHLHTMGSSKIPLNSLNSVNYDSSKSWKVTRPCLAIHTFPEEVLKQKVLLLPLGWYMYLLSERSSRNLKWGGNLNVLPQTISGNVSVALSVVPVTILLLEFFSWFLGFIGVFPK